VYTGTNTSSDEKVEIWITSSKAKREFAEDVLFYKALEGTPGFPLIRWLDVEGDRLTMVHDALGPSFEELNATQIGKLPFTVAIINITAMLGYGITIPEDEEKVVLGDQSISLRIFKNAQYLNNSTLKVQLQNTDADSALSFSYPNLVFIYGMRHHPSAMHYLGSEFPWEPLSNRLNSLLARDVNLECNEVPASLVDDIDITLSGLSWAKNYFQNASPLGKSLSERIFSLINDLADLGYGLSYAERKFSVLSTFSGKDELSSLSTGYVWVGLDDWN
jgi:hypothetical protein